MSALVKAMGPGSVKHVKSLVPAVIASLGDSKVWKNIYGLFTPNFKIMRPDQK
jgi:hypothetical protein